MTAPLTSIPGIGPATAEALQRAGIDSADSLRGIGAEEAYRRMVAAGARPHFIGFYALVMALQGRPWNDCKGAEKAALRTRFDALLAATPPGPEARLARFMDEFGLVPPRSGR